MYCFDINSLYAMTAFLHSVLNFFTL